METAERHSDLHPRTGRETEVGTAAVSTTSGTTATDHQAEHTSDAQVQKRRHTNPLPDYVPSTKMWPMGSKTVSKKPAVKMQTGCNGSGGIVARTHGPRSSVAVACCACCSNMLYQPSQGVTALRNCSSITAHNAGKHCRRCTCVSSTCVYCYPAKQAHQAAGKYSCRSISSYEVYHQSLVASHAHRACT